jgi:hypothetical protein
MQVPITLQIATAGWFWSDFWREQRRWIEAAIRYRRQGWTQCARDAAATALMYRKARILRHGR